MKGPVKLTPEQAADVALINRQNALLWLRGVAEKPDRLATRTVPWRTVSANACELRLAIEWANTTPYLTRRPSQSATDWLRGVLHGSNLEDIAYAKAVAATLRIQP